MRKFIDKTRKRDIIFTVPTYNPSAPDFIAVSKLSHRKRIYISERRTDMDFLKTLWPTPFKVKPGNVVSLIIQLIIFVVVCAIFGFLIGLLAGIPIIGIIFILIGSLMEIYSTVGIVLCFLKFFKVI